MGNVNLIYKCLLKFKYKKNDPHYSDYFCKRHVVILKVYTFLGITSSTPEGSGWLSIGGTGTHVALSDHVNQIWMLNVVPPTVYSAYYIQSATISTTPGSTSIRSNSSSL